MEIKCGRGRPSKNTGNPIQPETMAVATKSYTNRAGKVGFCFIIGREGERAFLRLRFGKQVPDFRYYTGVEREVLREFLARQKEHLYSFDFEGTVEDEYVIFNPDERLIERVLVAGLLRDAEETALSLAEGVYRCGLYIEETSAVAKQAPSAAINIALALRDEAGELAAFSRGASKASGDEQTARFYMLSPCFALAGDKVFRVEDLGSRWAETDRVAARVQKAELASMLSLICSTFTSLELIYEGWTMRRIRPAIAQPALLFKEIDDYGYLHVRPLNFLRGFPPQLLENRDIVSVAEVYETDKVIGIAEVVFPESPEDLFRVMLFKGRKGEAMASTHEENGLFIIEPEFARAFFTESILELSMRFVLMESHILARYKLNFSKPKLSFSLTSMGKGIDYLGGSASVELSGQTFSFARFMAEYRKSSCIMLTDGTRAFPDKRSMDRLERLVSRIKGDENAVELSYFDLPLLMDQSDIEFTGKAWEEARAFFNDYNAIAEQPGVWTLAGSALRPYQEYGVRWLNYMRQYQMGACLADEMGLGKTIQVIALLRGLYAAKAQGPCLVLCPKTLVFNWKTELEHFAPELPVLVHYSTGRDASAFEKQGRESPFRLILSTYTTIRRDVEDIKDIEFFYIILDESQNIKNLATKTSAAVHSLKAQHRLVLSGTPIENNLTELYSLFRFLNPSFFGSESLFNKRYLHPIQNNDDEALHDLKKRIYPFMLRRLKRDVLKDLPAKTEETAYIELEDEHLTVYHQRRFEYKQLIDRLIQGGEREFKKSSFIVLKALTELRRLASVPESDGEYGGPSAKRQYLMDRVSELVENGHKCLIFTNFLATVDLVSQDLVGMGIQNLSMTGATLDRQSLVRRFQTDDTVKAFIMTLKTGGTGLNLTAADYIFILDPWWNSAAENQAIDRAHRIGQNNPVFCYRFIACDTIEERIMELQKRKTDLFSALLSDDAGALKSLSADDVAYLVGAS